MTRIRKQGWILRGLASVPSVLSVLSVVLIWFCFGVAHAAQSENMAERSLRKIVERQKEVLGDAAKQGDKLDEGALRQQMQSIAHDYELLLRNNPDFAAGYAAYGYLLSKLDMRQQAMAMLLKAN